MMARAHAGAMLSASTALFLAPYNDSKLSDAPARRSLHKDGAEICKAVTVIL